MCLLIEKTAVGKSVFLNFEVPFLNLCITKCSSTWIRKLDINQCGMRCHRLSGFWTNYRTSEEIICSKCMKMFSIDQVGSRRLNVTTQTRRVTSLRTWFRNWRLIRRCDLSTQRFLISPCGGTRSITTKDDEWKGKRACALIRMHGHI